MKIDLLSLSWFVCAHANPNGINAALKRSLLSARRLACRMLCSRNPLIHENVFALVGAFRFLLKNSCDMIDCAEKRLKRVEMKMSKKIPFHFSRQVA